MASVYSKSGKWYLRYKDAGGRWVDRVTQAETKTEAKRLSGEVQRKVERHRLGIAESPSDCRLTLTELCDWWLKNRCPPAREYNERKRLQRHVLASPLGRTPIRLVSAGLIENQLRRMEEQNLSAATINGLRGTLGTVFNRARKAGIWTGPNPIQDVESRREPKKVRATLRAEEVSVLLPHVPRDWQALFATALLTGMRKGELFSEEKRCRSAKPNAAGGALLRQAYNQGWPRRHRSHLPAIDSGAGRRHPRVFERVRVPRPQRSDALTCR